MSKLLMEKTAIDKSRIGRIKNKNHFKNLNDRLSAHETTITGMKHIDIPKIQENAKLTRTEANKILKEYRDTLHGFGKKVEEKEVDAFGKQMYNLNGAQLNKKHQGDDIFNKYLPLKNEIKQSERKARSYSKYVKNIEKILGPAKQMQMAKKVLPKVGLGLAAAGGLTAGGVALYKHNKKMKTAEEYKEEIMKTAMFSKPSYSVGHALEDYFNNKLTPTQRKEIKTHVNSQYGTDIDDWKNSSSQKEIKNQINDFKSEPWSFKNK